MSLQEAQPGALDEREWNLPWKGAFLVSLALIPNASAAARTVGISRARAYQERDTDAEFAEAWAAAIDVGVELMEQIAHRRATTGEVRRLERTTIRVGEDGKPEKTTVVEEVTVVSNDLLKFLLQAYKPDVFNRRQEHRHVGANGGPIVHEVEVYRVPTRDRMLALVEIARELEPGAADVVDVEIDVEVDEGEIGES